MKKVYAFAVVCILLTGIAAAHFHRTFNPHVTVYKWPHKKTIAFTVTCDDISAGYPLEYFEEIQSLFETYGVRGTFFVIPYHGEWDLLTDSPQFVEALQKAEARGHEIGLHGYAHYEDEFVCSADEQRQLLKKAVPIMQKTGVTVKGFRAPCLKATDDTLEVLEEFDFLYDSSTFGESGESSFEGALPEIPSGYEYTWYIRAEELPQKINEAKQDFLEKYAEGTVFSLVTHIKAVNEGEGIHFLTDFLSYVRTKDVWNATLIELVEWEKSVQNVTWESRKTLTGGDIIFHNIPAGMVAEIRVPLRYKVKDLPQRTVITTDAIGNERIIELTCEKPFDEITIPFVITYTSPAHHVEDEVLVLTALGRNVNTDCLECFFDVWRFCTLFLILTPAYFLTF
jgi:predicted deacetylase